MGWQRLVHFANLYISSEKELFLCAAVLRRACTSKEPTKWCHPMAIRIFRKMMSAIHLGEVFVQETEQLISFVLC